MADEIEKLYIEIFQNHGDVIRGKSSSVLNSVRTDAFEAFKSAGLPTTRTESYKYTDMASRFATDYGMNLDRMDLIGDPSALFKCEVPNLDCHLFFVVNDTFYCPQSELNELSVLKEKGVLVGSLHDHAISHPDLVAQYYDKIQNKKDAYAHFNTAFAQDGFFLFVPKGVAIEKPIQLIFVMKSDAPILANPRNLIIIDEDAKARLLVCYHTMTEATTLQNGVTEVSVGRNATYDHYKLENTANDSNTIESLFINQEEGSNVLVNDITLHNGLTRNNVDISLNGQYCETLLCGMVVADEKEHVDNSTNIHHNKPNSKSRELYKYVLNDASTGVFSGQIHVAPNAQKTEAYQTNRNICMTANARMYTRPQLEIYADDVKCSHGASTGQMDETAMFYLRSRGIPEAEAKMLLMFAFVNDVLENIRIDALQEKIKSLVEKRFRGELSKCSGCNMCG